MASAASSPLLQGSLVSRLNFGSYVNQASDPPTSRRHTPSTYGTLSPAVAVARSQPIVRLPAAVEGNAFIPESSARKIRQLMERYKELKEKNTRLKQLCRQQQSVVAAFQHESVDLVEQCDAMKASRDKARRDLAQALEDMERVEMAREASEQRIESLMGALQARRHRLSSTPLKYQLKDTPTDLIDEEAFSSTQSNGRKVAATGSGPNQSVIDSAGHEEKRGSSVVGRGVSMFGSLLSSVSGDGNEIAKLKSELEIVIDELGRKIEENENLHMTVFELKTREESERKLREETRIRGDQARQTISDEVQELRRTCSQLTLEADKVRRERDSIAERIKAQATTNTERVKQVMNTAARAVNEARCLRQRLCLLSGQAAYSDFMLQTKDGRALDQWGAWNLPRYDKTAHSRRLACIAGIFTALLKWINGWCDVVSATAAWIRTQIAFPMLVLCPSSKPVGDATLPEPTRTEDNDHICGLRAIALRLVQLGQSLTKCSACAKQICASIVSGAKLEQASRCIEEFVTVSLSLKSEWRQILPECLNLLALGSVDRRCLAVESSASRDATEDLDMLELRFQRSLSDLAAHLKLFDNWLDSFVSMVSVSAESGSCDGSTSAAHESNSFVELFCSWYSTDLDGHQVRQYQQWVQQAVSLRDFLPKLVECSIAAVEFVSSHPTQDVIVQRSGMDVQHALRSAGDTLQPMLRALREVYEQIGEAENFKPLDSSICDWRDQGYNSPTAQSMASRFRFDVDSINEATASFYASPITNRQPLTESEPSPTASTKQAVGGPASTRTPPAPRTPKNMLTLRSRDEETVQARVGTSTRCSYNEQRARSVDFMRQVNCLVCNPSHTQGTQGPPKNNELAADTSDRSNVDSQAGGTPGSAPESPCTRSHTEADVVSSRTAACAQTKSIGVNTDDDQEVLQLKSAVQKLRTQMVLFGFSCRPMPHHSFVVSLILIGCARAIPGGQSPRTTESGGKNGGHEESKQTPI
eukprot:INCI1061.3.p1 GENE.INCI1061.3~~INCI1061.3.p1  ORF type:complete len:987 (-),score=139.81 INCI1061.3:557-3517(-)